jgi:hypothetical protein
MNGKRSWKNKPFWIRFVHWEYWNFHFIYLPLYPIFIYYCIRARSFFFFAAANPCIKNGGYLGESKKDLYKLLPENLQPRTLFFSVGTNPQIVIEQLQSAGFLFPLIGKPDIGGRGRGIKKLDTVQEVSDYAEMAGMDYHIQEFVDYKNEAGIFYYRYPGEHQGNISGIVQKIFLGVTGDGIRTVQELLKMNPRGILQINSLEKTDPRKLDLIIPKGELFTVSPYGNHARGALFLDDSASANTALVKMMNDLCNLIPDFYYGRLDIRYQNRELLEQGTAFSVIEVNGAGSEPTHIYDPQHSIFYAWKEIVRHWKILYSISRANHRLGFPYLSISEGKAMYLKEFSDKRILEKMQNDPSY